jgi:hypothetical protein
MFHNLLLGYDNAMLPRERRVNAALPLAVAASADAGAKPAGSKADFRLRNGTVECQQLG